ncbi:hypothetical protein HYW44_01000 [Candidatus Daviesbacteria bacterium]|nr:hypothetical protein [Candidatus Daviesbacteria bacterium]
MTATAHALVGGAIAYSVQNPALGISLSFLSHPLLDFIPHWDFAWGWRKKTKFKLFCEASLDLTAGIVLSYALFGQFMNPYYFLACLFGSVVWDLMEIPYWFFNWRFFPFSFLHNIQHHIQGKAKLPWGVLTQVVTVGVIILLLQNFHTV